MSCRLRAARSVSHDWATVVLLNTMNTINQEKMNIVCNFICVTLYFIERQCTKHKTVPLSRMDRKCPQERWGYLGVNRPNTKNTRTARGGRPHHSALQVNEVKGLSHCTESQAKWEEKGFPFPSGKLINYFRPFHVSQTSQSRPKFRYL